ncbi:tetratricopeptide repeat protein [Oscillatoria sp. CS-180]|uniref:tetratricopeptide repeat protein n=1 Tax=Oscillatoria sp. CS-180 TaxID=3021720 RepID=UPI002330BD55|nr:tetratricopeptide repeat protein [Oscillatoria sp. CS-180]MDB9527785.1 tetratricopeptide repeat protein [Oscillatoria sp. CS-180]
MSISLCMIVKDEADNLPGCLNSVEGCVDEMIVLDTGSQDETIAIAEQHGATVESTEWQQDFAAARNQSLTQASGDWVLVLDADETLTDAGRTLLQQVRSGHQLGQYRLDNVLAVNLLRHEVNADQSPYTEVSRLFRRRPDIQFTRPYHESIDDSVNAIMQREPHWQVVTWPQVVIDHTGYEADAISQRGKFARAERIMAAYLAEHPHDAYICNKLGALYSTAGNWEQGRSLLEQGLRADQVDPSTLYELHYHLGLGYRQAGLPAIAVDHYSKALMQPVPEILKVGAYINLGSLLQARKNYRAAIEQFEKATAAAPNFALAHFNLGVARRGKGDLEGAVAAYEKAVSIQPNYAVAYQNMGVTLFKLSQLPESIQAFRRAIALYQQTNPAEADRLLQGIRNLGIQSEG